MPAYDYQQQKWVHGAQGAELLQAQLNEELALLQSSQGQAYATMINADRQVAISSIKMQLDAFTS